jgi:hypothetical protein
MDTSSIVVDMVRVRLSDAAPPANQASHGSHVDAAHASPTQPTFHAEREHKQDDKNKDPVTSNPALPRATSVGEILAASEEEPETDKAIKKPATSTTRGRTTTRVRGRGRGRPARRATQNNQQDDNTGGSKEEGKTKDMDGGDKTPSRAASSKAKPSPSPRSHSPKTSSPCPERVLKRPAAKAAAAEVPADESVKKALWIQFHNMDHPVKLDSLTSQQEAMLENGVPHSYVPDPSEAPPPKVPRHTKTPETKNKQKKDTASSSPRTPFKRPAAKAGQQTFKSQEYLIYRL